VSSRPGQGSGWRARLYWVLGKAPEASVGIGCERDEGSTAAAPMAWWRALRPALDEPAAA
jgi:hypothetical protein